MLEWSSVETDVLADFFADVFCDFADALCVFSGIFGSAFVVLLLVVFIDDFAIA